MMNKIEMLLQGKGYPVSFVVEDEEQATNIYNNLVDAVNDDVVSVTIKAKGALTTIRAEQVLAASLVPSAILDEETKIQEERMQAVRIAGSQGLGVGVGTVGGGFLSNSILGL